MYQVQRKRFRICDMHVCQIYVLIASDGEPFYIGRTKRPLRFRMNEHKVVLGFMPRYRIVATCSSNCRKVEQRWIEKYRAAGYRLTNVYCGSQGSHFIPDSVRNKMSLAHRGRKITWAHKISAAQKGKPKNWSPEGRKRVQAAQFKAGTNPLQAMSQESRERHRLASVAQWANKSEEERRQPALRLIAALRRDPVIREKQRQGIIRAWRRRRGAVAV